VESDHLQVVQAINPMHTNTDFGSLIGICRKFIGLSNNCKVNYVGDKQTE
jgi:hypothetical protein